MSSRNDSIQTLPWSTYYILSYLGISATSRLGRLRENIRTQNGESLNNPAGQKDIPEFSSMHFTEHSLEAIFGE